MRITADRDDPDFIGDGNYGRYRVLLNGAPLPDCVEADDQAGYAVVYMRDDDGHLDIDRVKQEVRRHVAKGVVRIIDTRGPH